MNLILLDSTMSLITPDPGLVFWTVLIFLILWGILGKFAFKPIVNALNDRNKSIDEALKSAENARKEMASLTAKNEEIIKEAREERVKIINEAKASADKFRNEQMEKAKLDASKLLADAKVEIDNQKKAALTEVKNEVGKLAVELSEKILRKQLANDAAQQEFVGKLVEEAKMN